LTSDFCKKEEIPYLLKRRTEQGMRLLPVLLRPCPWKLVSWLKPIQILPDDTRPIASLSSAKREQVFAGIATSIGELLAQPAVQEQPVFESVRRRIPVPERAAINRPFSISPSGSLDLDVSSLLPGSGEVTRFAGAGIDLFGRDDELSWLDELWETGTVRVVSVTGPIGIGKTALVNTWCARTEQEHGEEACWIRIVDNAGSQPAVAALLAEVTQHKSRELLLLASREPLAELDRLPQELVARKELGPLSPSAGRALLRVAGVRGTDAELEEISRSLGGLPAALVRRATAPFPPSA